MTDKTFGHLRGAEGAEFVEVCVDDLKHFDEKKGAKWDIWAADKTKLEAFASLQKALYDTGGQTAKQKAPHGQQPIQRCLRRAQAGHEHTSLDCVWGFTHISVDDTIAKFLALITRRGLLTPKVLYFGQSKVRHSSRQ